MAMRLSEGDRVGIVGGGPAGSFAALHLLQGMRERGLNLEVLIFEPRDFSRPGPSGCNRCAGILSSSMLRGLSELEIDLPEAVVQSEISSYSIDLQGDLIQIQQPDANRQIVSIYRGGGPRLAEEATESFDEFLLSQARQRGAFHIPHRVHRVEPGERPVLRTIEDRYPVDLVLLATGVNSRPPMDPAFGYLPPKTAIMAQDEFLRPEAWPEETVSAYFNQPPGLIFGALIPKGQYINVSLLGRDMSLTAVGEFLEAQGLSPYFQSNPKSLCGCTPRIAIKASQRYYGPRWAAVGDASVTRLYKDGIGSAYLTAKAVVDTALDRGVSREAFLRGYRPTHRRIAIDNRYGRLLFAMWHRVLSKPKFRDVWSNMLHMEDRKPLEQRVHSRIIWGMLTGDDTYKDLFRLSLSPQSLREIGRAFLKGLQGSR